MSVSSTFYPLVTTASHLSGSSPIPVWCSGIMLLVELAMVMQGLKFAIGIGIGCVLLLIAAVMVSGVIFRLEDLAYRRGWLDEPHRAMPKTLGTVVPFGPRPTSYS